MALGHRRRERQMEAFVAASDLPKSPGHPFYTALNRLLAENGFDALVAGDAPTAGRSESSSGLPPPIRCRTTPA
jgi:transposase